MNKLSVVIPSFNEEDRIVYTLEKTLAYLKTRDYRSEILVVSDGSTDNTASVVKGMDSGEEKIRLEYLEYHPNRGKGYAVRFGMLKARFDLVMFMDADYSVEMSEVEKGIRLIEDGFDVAIASRAIKGAIVSHHQNFIRELSAKAYTFIQNLYLGIHYRDTQCGFKIFTRKAALNLFLKQRLESVIFDPEILWLAKNEGFSVAEFPVNWTHMENSRIQYDSLKKSMFVFKELFRIKKLHASSE